MPIIGDFNVVNAAGAAAAAWALGMPAAEVAERLRTLPQVPGRLEVLSERPLVLRDYAHTPDALERALRAVRPFVEGRLITVFGCGGDRDRAKRPLKGRAATELADLTELRGECERDALVHGQELLEVHAAVDRRQRVVDEQRVGNPIERAAVRRQERPCLGVVLGDDPLELQRVRREQRHVTRHLPRARRACARSRRAPHARPSRLSR